MTIWTGVTILLVGSLAGIIYGTILPHPIDYVASVLTGAILGIIWGEVSMNDEAFLPLVTVVGLVAGITGMVMAFALMALPAFLGFFVGKHWREEK